MKIKVYIIILTVIFTYCCRKGYSQEDIWTVSGTSICIDESTNNIGIGTTTPDKELTVNGKIHAQELKVGLSVTPPDYVFDKEYNLISLRELEDFILKNKHLPDIPSASKMEQDGVNISEMSMLLLKKTEEITLYILNHEKRIEAMEQSINEH